MKLVFRLALERCVGVECVEISLWRKQQEAGGEGNICAGKMQDVADADIFSMWYWRTVLFKMP